MPVSIIYNPSAVNSRNNLVNANLGMDTAIQRMSSGQRISKASDDVAGLAVGTQLQSNVSILKAAANNVQQGNSLLAIADGALDNISQMLQRMLSLSSQSTSAALNDASRAYLNQEFQSLKNEINRLSQFTKFNDTSLLDGSFGKAFDFDYTKENDIADIAKKSGKDLNTLVVDKAELVKETHIVANMKSLGNSISLSNNPAAGATAPTAGNLGAMNIEYGAEKSTWLINIGTATYKGEVSNKLGASKSAVLTNTNGSGESVVIANNSSVPFDVRDQGDATTLANALKYGFGAIAYSTGMDLATTANTAGQTLDHLNVVSIPDKIADMTIANNSFSISDGAGGAPAGGKVTSFKADYVDSNNSIWSVQIGAQTFQGNISNTLGVGQLATLTALDGSGDQINITNSNVTRDLNISSQSDANQFASALEYAFKDIAYVTTMDAAAIAQKNNRSAVDFNVLSKSAKVLDMSNIGKSLQFSGEDTSGTIDDFRITYGDVKSRWSVTIGGVQYSTKVDNQLRSQGEVKLVATDNSGKILTMKNNTSRSMSINSQVDAERLFGVLNNSVKTGVIFQVGTIASDQISIGLGGNSTTMLGIEESVIDSIGSPTHNKAAFGATLAVDKVGKALQTILAHRAEVGALTSRFDKAFDSINTSAQNQDAARGVYLDADIAEESSKLASEKVRMNAAISTLAQSNERSQSLLKLLG